MKAKSLPEFINREHMVFITKFSEDELMSIHLMKDAGVVERIESLGNGQVIWFHDRRETIKFLLTHG